MIPNEAVEAAAVAASGMYRAQLEYAVKMESLLAHAAVLSVPESRVREIVAAEHDRAQTEFKGFSWATVQNQVNAEAWA